MEHPSQVKPHSERVTIMSESTQRASKTDGTDDRLKKANASIEKDAEAVDAHLSFPQKLMELLDDESHASVIAWLPHGRGFQVFCKVKFEKEIMPKFFQKNSKCSSFSRKLNRWGFTRVSKGAEAGAYFHQHFQRGDHRGCLKMSCQSTSSKISHKTSRPEVRPAALRAKNTGGMPRQFETLDNDSYATHLGPSIQAASLGGNTREEAALLLLLAKAQQQQTMQQQAQRDLEMQRVLERGFDERRHQLQRALSMVQRSSSVILASPLLGGVLPQTQVPTASAKASSPWHNDNHHATSFQSSDPRGGQSNRTILDELLRSRMAFTSGGGTAIAAAPEAGTKIDWVDSVRHLSQLIGTHSSHAENPATSLASVTAAIPDDNRTGNLAWMVPPLAASTAIKSLLFGSAMTRKCAP